jgi:hypothetical protein
VNAVSVCLALKASQAIQASFFNTSDASRFESVVALHPVLVGEGGGAGTGVFKVEVVAGTASAATTIDLVGFIVN